MPTFSAVTTTKAPQPVANYSQATRVGGLLFLSGQGGFDPDTMQLAGTDMTSQTRQALKNLGAVLEEAGADFSNVVSIRYFITDHGHFGEMNAVHGEFFANEPFPARTTVTTGLGPDMLVEIDAIAHLE